MTRQDALAECVLQSRGLMMRYLTGFDDSNHTRTAESLPNHVAWVLGHCAMTMHRAAERIDGKFDDADFYVGEMSGDSRKFGTESIAFGSDPRRAGELGVSYPTFARCVEVFTRAADRLAAALRACPDKQLDEDTVFFGGMSLPRWNVVPRIVFHNGHHCGQVADLRRALGMPSVF